MSGADLLKKLSLMSPAQLKMPVFVRAELTMLNERGSDDFHDVEDPATCVFVTETAIIIEAK